MAPNHPTNLADISNEHTVRVLFVIPRIGGESGAAYQSTGMRLVNGLCQQCRAYFQMEVLHAPTFTRLAERLQRAKKEGKPFHVLHYDGHGIFLKATDLDNQGNLLAEIEDEGKEQGLLLLEGEGKPEFVDGKVLGKLLVENDVLILALNAAHAPLVRDNASTDGPDSVVSQGFEDVIQRCLAIGLPAALAMPGFDESDAAATFLGDVYSALAQGVDLKEAVASERKYFKGLDRLARAGELMLPAGWQSPKIFGRAGVQTASREGLEGTPVFRINIMAHGEEVRPERLDARLLRAMPETGIFGRDELVLKMEQAFDQQGVLLLYGQKGTGKTTAALEFARWLANAGFTGDQPILYSSLSTCVNLSDMLEDFGQVYQAALRERGIIWNELEDHQRIRLIKDLCKKVPLLWIWDDYESVSQNSYGLWEKTEKDQLMNLAAALTDKVARLLIVSDNAEKALEDKAIRLKITPLAHSSKGALAEAYLRKHPELKLSGEQRQQLMAIGIENVKSLLILLKQPTLLTEETLAGPPDALVNRFLASCSLEEQGLIALTWLFHNVLNVDVLREMGNAQHPWSLLEIRGLDMVRIQKVLHRAGQYSLLSFISGRYYLLDNTLVSSLESLFKRIYPGEAAQAAFAKALSALSRDLASRWESGDKEQLGLLSAEETNLKRALMLARRSGDRYALAGLLMGLRLTHLQNKRYVPWARLLNTAAPEFLTQTGKLRRELGTDAVMFVDDCIEVSRLRLRFKEAARWQDLRVDYEHRQAVNALKANPQKLGPEELPLIQALTTSQAILGDLWSQAGDPKAIAAYKDGFRISKRFQQTQQAADFAYRIAREYITIPAAQNLPLARRWTKKSMDLRDPEDKRGRGQSKTLYGMAALEKFVKGQKESRPGEEQIGLINQALGYYFDALDWLPEDALAEMGMIHETIGYLYFQAENTVEPALEHYDQAIKLKELAQDGYGAAKASFNAAVALFLLTRFDLGRRYATQALRGFEALGAAVESDIQKTRGMLAKFANSVEVISE